MIRPQEAFAYANTVLLPELNAILQAIEDSIIERRFYFLSAGEHTEGWLTIGFGSRYSSDQYKSTFENVERIMKEDGWECDSGSSGSPLGSYFRVRIRSNEYNSKTVKFYTTERLIS